MAGREKLKYLECGKIINTHGVKGTVKVESWCDSPEILAKMKTLYFKTGKDSFDARNVESAYVNKSTVLLKLSGINSVEEAIMYKGKLLFAKREDFELPDGEYFIAELIGCEIVDATDGEKYGELKDIINYGASDIYVIDTADGEKMMPAVDEFVKEIDYDNGRIYVSVIPGMFD